MSIPTAIDAKKLTRAGVKTKAMNNLMPRIGKAICKATSSGFYKAAVVVSEEEYYMVKDIENILLELGYWGIKLKWENLSEDSYYNLSFKWS